MSYMSRVGLARCAIVSRLSAFHPFIDGFVVFGAAASFVLVGIQIRLVRIYVLLGLRVLWHWALRLSLGLRRES